MSRNLILLFITFFVFLYSLLVMDFNLHGILGFDFFPNPNYIYHHPNFNLFEILFPLNRGEDFFYIKYVPIYEILNRILHFITNGKYENYLLANIFCLIFIAMTSFILFEKISKSKFFSTLATLTLVTSLFVLQPLLGAVWGSCFEYASVVWFILFLISGFKFIDTQKNRYFYLTIVFSCLAALDHPRYFCLSISMIIFCLIYNKSKYDLVKKFVLISIPPLISVLGTVYLVGVSFFRGTAGGIEMDFNLQRIYDFCIQSFKNILGIYNGEPYIWTFGNEIGGGLINGQAATVISFISVVFAFCIVGFIICYIFNFLFKFFRYKKLSNEHLKFIFVFFAFCILLVCSIGTIRVEPRFLQAPFYCVIVSLCIIWNSITQSSLGEHVKKARLYLFNIMKKTCYSLLSIFLITFMCSNYIAYCQRGYTFFATAHFEIKEAYEQYYKRFELLPNIEDYTVIADHNLDAFFLPNHENISRTLKFYLNKKIRVILDPNYKCIDLKCIKIERVWLDNKINDATKVRLKIEVISS